MCPLLVAVVVCVSVIARVPVTCTSEQAGEFLKALHDRGLDELSLDYLDRMRTSPLAGDDFRRRIPLEQGLVLLSLSRRAADAAVRSQRLDEARKQLEEFAAANPTSVEAAEAEIQIGGVLVEQGRQAAARAARISADDTGKAQRERLREEGRRYLTDAGGQFERVAASLSTDLRQQPLAPASDAEVATGNRKELRARVAQAQYLAANSKFEIAQTFDVDSSKYRELHEAAAKELSALSDKYSSASIWAYFARLDEGRCYQALGQYSLALGCFQDIISRAASEASFRPLISRAGISGGMPCGAEEV